MQKTKLPQLQPNDSSTSVSEVAGRPSTSRVSKTLQPTLNALLSKKSTTQLSATERDPLESHVWTEDLISNKKNPLEEESKPHLSQNESETAVQRAGKLPAVKEDKKSATEKKKKYLQKKWLLIAGGIAAAIIFIIIIIGVVVFLLTKGKGKEETDWYSKKMCPNVTKCSKSGYSKPPLLLISIDGFRRDYLDQPDWARWLKKMADCGVTTEKVYPVYPSKTFPNHYTQVTGLYPIYHGIVDNKIWDKKLNPTSPASYNNFTAEYFKALPIWKYYMAAGGRANCFFWPGSDQHHCSETAFFNHSTKPKEQVAKVREWLKLPEETRPGFMTLYSHHLDGEGHRNTQPNILNNKEVEKSVKEMDQLLHEFLQSLADDGLLNCVNIIVVSDHGMVKVEETIEIEKIFKERHIFDKGPVARIYSSHADTFIHQETAVCQQNNKKFLLTTDDNRPSRLHHSGNPIIGDVVIDERLGISFQQKNSQSHPSSHGYDYLYSEMQTIFFARGPSFRPGVILPPFQQIEYFNLFLDLLGLKYVANNGTMGIFDPAMTDPPKRAETKNKEIEKCPSYPQVTPCCHMSWPCSSSNGLQLFASKLDYCFIPLHCQKMVYSYKGDPRAVMETVSRPTGNAPCYLHIGSTGTCGNLGNYQSMSADKNVMMSSLLIPDRGNFMKTVTSALDELQKELLKKTSKLFVLSGTAVDRNRDVIADNEDLIQSTATHFYRLYVYCKNNKYGEKAICKETDQLTTLGFIFPLISRDPNCLDGKDLLLYYSARLKDVETIAGLELMLADYNDHEKAILRTKIIEQL